MIKSGFYNKCFKDASGRQVLAQAPNRPLVAGLILAAAAAAAFKLPALSYVLRVLAFGAFFVWAWLEIFEGVNYFRRALGLIVLATIVTLAVVFR
ncbi:MAG: hypothetical protein ACREGA_03425 [Candidatus Saccharimonadales bacterium]